MCFIDFQSNYVLYHDDLLAKEEPRYDTILCLSVTKWIHLNWGDDGLIRAFKRRFLQLRSGGVLILEAQPFESYKKKKLPVRILEYYSFRRKYFSYARFWSNVISFQVKLRSNVDKIELFPSMFENYLISKIGFKSCETLPVPNNKSQGFQRPVQIFQKKWTQRFLCDTTFLAYARANFFNREVS